MKYLALTLVLLITRSAFAAVPAVSFTGGLFDSFADDTIGFRFTVGDSDISVSALGFYDRGFDGLSDAHDVAIFHVLTESAVLSATIPSGAVAPLEDGFRFLEVTPATLLAGGTYVINGYRPTAADGILFNASKLTTAPFLTYDTQVAANRTGGLAYTNTPFPDAANGWFGPNFKADVVPEPASGALLLVGAVLFCGRRTRRAVRRLPAMISTNRLSVVLALLTGFLASVPVYA